MKVLLSIKPEFANLIFSEEKKYEFRKSIFRRSDIDAVVLYATMPVGLIVGEFTLGDIFCDSPSRLWQRTKDYAGITKSFFDNYFSCTHVAYAISIINPVVYRDAYDPHARWPRFTPPQSFCYFDEPSLFNSARS
jgi:predicted transcriptional regulator